VFQDYLMDFNFSEENVLDFIFTYVEVEQEVEQLVEMVQAKQVMIKYEN